jgi:hypothetical protein
MMAISAGCPNGLSEVDEIEEPRWWMGFPVNRSTGNTRSLPYVVLPIWFAVVASTAAWSHSAEQPAQSAATSPPESQPRGVKVEGKKKAVERGGRVFGSPDVFQLHLQLPSTAMERMQADHRPYERGVLTEAGQPPWESVGVKLKGAAGSFQDFSGKPGFTINLDKFRKKQSFDGLDKFHLNNSVQDETYLNEWLGSEIFRLAGYPAPRVSHALVRLNDGQPSLYVLRESYGVKLLERFFQNPNGNLYDGGFVQDLDAELEKDSGDGVDDHSDLKGLVEALRQEDPEARIQDIERCLDVERFIDFMALEEMICHWDGYSANTNNYRLYFDPETRKAIFMPHGMDQIFGDTSMGLFDMNGSLVARQILGSDRWRARYRQRILELMPIFVPANDLIARVDAAAARLKPAIEELGEEAVANHQRQIGDLKQRLRERSLRIVEQFQEEEPVPLSFGGGDSILLPEWSPAADNDQIAIDTQTTGEGVEVLRVRVPSEQPGAGSWRRSLLLARGNYQVTGRFRVLGLKRLDENQAETLVTGTNFEEQWKAVDGSQDWSEFVIGIQVREDRRAVEARLGIRVSEGELQIDRSSLRIVRLGQ